MVLHCLNDYKNLGLHCTEALELPWKYPSPFTKDRVKLMVEGRRSKCLLWGSTAGSLSRQKICTRSQLFPVLPSSGGRQGAFRCVYLVNKVLIPSADCQYQHSLHSLPKERVRWISWPNFSWGMKLYPKFSPQFQLNVILFTS